MRLRNQAQTYMGKVDQSSTAYVGSFVADGETSPNMRTLLCSEGKRPYRLSHVSYIRAEHSDGFT